MKTGTKRKRRKVAEIRAAVMQNNLMKRFIYEIEREEPLDDLSLHTILAYEPIRVR